MMMPKGNRRECSSPIDAADLMDYWLAALSPQEEDVVEQHLMACDQCGDRLRESIALADSLRVLARSGSLNVIVSDQFVRHAAEAGRRVREYAPARGESIQCTVAADDDLLLARLSADLTGASRVDLSWRDPRGIERQRMEDIPVGGDAGTVILQQSITWAKASPTSSMTARLLAIDQHGGERVLGEYTFSHTRTIPGPPGWTLD
jgi:anti-sigma factor RsiW